MTTRLDAHGPEMHRKSAWKHPCRVAAVGPIDLSLPGATIDGIALVLGDRVFVREQASAEENGLYEWRGPATWMIRAYDFQNGVEAWGCLVRVTSGTVGAGRLWANTNLTLPELETDGLEFEEIAGDLTFVHVQTLAATTWVINHDLGKFPSVAVVDSGGNLIFGSVVYTSLNVVTVDFSTAFSGSAYCN